MANHCFDWKQSDLDTEYAQATEEGRHMEALETEFAAVRAIPEQTQTFQTAFDNLCDLVQQSKLHEEAAKNEPNDFEDIVALLPQPPPSQPPRIDSAFVDRIYGAWLGRCTGCLLGKPVEGWRSPRLHGMLQAGGWELPHDYLWNLELSDDQHEAFDTARIRSMGNNLTGMPEDDDINYTITGLAILKQHGFDFSTDHVGTFWLHHLPILHTWTAERVAYRNLVNRIQPPASAIVRNPYREWIGAQIRGDFFGYAAAGNPLLAAELAWRDARLSHVKNGIYGEMWVAGMLAYAAVAPTPEILPVIQAGLACIPPECRLSRSIRKMIERYQAGHSWQQVVAAIHQEWDENKRHHWCHTISNAEIVTLALLWGENDAVRTLALAVYPAFDTDCNGATAGSVFGMLHGKNAFPRYLSEPLRDTIYSGVAGYHKVAIGDMVEQTLTLIRQRPDL